MHKTLYQVKTKGDRELAPAGPTVTLTVHVQQHIMSKFKLRPKPFTKLNLTKDINNNINT